MNYQVGRTTLAIALIAMGAALVYDNIMGTGFAWSLFRLWPALLILLGLEWIIAAALPGQRLQSDAGAIVLLIIGFVVMATLSTAWRTVNAIQWNFNSGRGLRPLA